MRLERFSITFKEDGRNDHVTMVTMFTLYLRFSSKIEEVSVSIKSQN